jgi:hypothetical protein
MQPLSLTDLFLESDENNREGNPNVKLLSLIALSKYPDFVKTARSLKETRELSFRGHLEARTSTFERRKVSLEKSSADVLDKMRHEVTTVQSVGKVIGELHDVLELTGHYREATSAYVRTGERLLPALALDFHKKEKGLMMRETAHALENRDASPVSSEQSDKLKKVTAWNLGKAAVRGTLEGFEDIVDAITHPLQLIESTASVARDALLLVGNVGVEAALMSGDFAPIPVDPERQKKAVEEWREVRPKAMAQTVRLRSF